MNFAHKISLPKKDHWEMSKWCEEKFGPRWEAVGNRKGTWCVFWGGRSIPGSYRWHFQNEQDYLLFTLRWL